VKRIQEHLSLFVVLFAEIESLRKRVRTRREKWKMSGDLLWRLSGIEMIRYD